MPDFAFRLDEVSQRGWQIKITLPATGAELCGFHHTYGTIISLAFVPDCCDAQKTHDFELMEAVSTEIRLRLEHKSTHTQA